MSYIKSTDFAVKDSLLSGDPEKIVRGTEIDDEFNNIAADLAPKVDGPASATDNDIARFDSTTGKLLKAGLKYQTSATDTTAGALLVQGAFNLGIGQFAKNKIINSKMESAQRGTSFPAAVNGAYPLDRWIIVGGGTDAVVSVSQAGADSEFSKSLSVGVSTADSSIAASQSLNIQHRIEGYNVSDLVGSTFTLSFRVYATKKGVYCVSFSNLAADRSYVAEFTVNVSNTWEAKTVTVVGGIPSSDTWNFTSGIGLTVRWAMASGSSFHTTAGAWQTGNFQSTANQVNCLDTVGNLFAITGVQLEVGSVATPFEHRPYGAELALCQRYYQISTVSVRGVATGASQYFNVPVYFHPMRVTPTASLPSSAGKLNISSAFLVPAPGSNSNSGRYEVGPANAGEFYSIHEPLTLSAEL